MNFSSWTTSLSTVGGGYVESLSKNAKALAASAAQTGQGIAHLVQRPEAEPGSDDDQEQDHAEAASRFSSHLVVERVLETQGLSAALHSRPDLPPVLHQPRP